MIVEYLPVESIKVDVNQPRKIFNEENLEQLKESIRAKRIEVPLMVRECDENDSIYILVDGERRLRSAKALNLKEVPCIIDRIHSVHPQMYEVDVMSKQLRLDFLKNKLTGEELDVALYDMWLSLETLSEEALAVMGIKPNASRDWRIPFISRETGVGYTQVTMSLNKEDFKQRNKNFHDKIAADVENDPIKGKRYNRILGETSRHEGFRTDDDKRKTVIEGYLNESVSGDGKELRENLKKISNTESPTEKQIRKMFGLDDSSVEKVKDSGSKPDVSKLNKNIFELNEEFKGFVDAVEAYSRTIVGMKDVLGRIDPTLIAQLKTSLIQALESLGQSSGE